MSSISLLIESKPRKIPDILHGGTVQPSVHIYLVLSVERFNIVVGNQKIHFSSEKAHSASLYVIFMIVYNIN